MSAPFPPVNAHATVNADAAVELVMQLMAIPGRSGQESAILQGVKQALRDAGVPDDAMLHDTAHQRSPLGGELGNLIVRLPGTHPGPRRLLMAHVDTVPICIGCEPFRDGDWIRSRNPQTGLGGDDRAGVAVIITAVRELLRQRLPHPPLTLFFAVQEEVGLYGARFVTTSELGDPAFCFNWDGGDPETACVGATGDYALRIELEGVASHAGVHPEQGVSAIAIASLAIADLVKNGWHGLIQKGDRRGTSNVGFIQAGEATNVVTPHLSLRAECRSHDPVFRQEIVAAYRQAFESAARQVTAVDGTCGKVTFAAQLQYESFRLDESAPVVQAALTAIRQVGLEPRTRMSNGGLDANWLTAHGFPTVTLGCGQDDIHTVRECLNLPAFIHGCKIALRLATGI